MLTRYLFILDRHASEFIFYGFQMIFNPPDPALPPPPSRRPRHHLPLNPPLPEADANCMRHVTARRTDSGRMPGIKLLAPISTHPQDGDDYASTILRGYIPVQSRFQSQS